MFVVHHEAAEVAQPDEEALDLPASPGVPERARRPGRLCGILGAAHRDQCWHVRKSEDHMTTQTPGQSRRWLLRRFNPKGQFKVDGMTPAFAAFRKAYPSYDATHKLDELRSAEYARLDRQGQVYLDYTCGGLYAESQVREHIAMVCNQVFCNAQSHNLASIAMTHRGDQARDYLLKY